MRQTLKQYHVTLTTQGPVFVGDGTELNKKEYIITPDGQNVVVLDMNLLWRLLGRYRGMQDQFQEFMMCPWKKSIEDWLQRECKLPIYMLQQCAKETIPSGYGSLNSNAKDRIMNFIRDPYGKPYVPGSSLKGMLRTVLLSEKTHGDPEHWKTAADHLMRATITGNSKRDARLENEEIETQAFKTLNRKEKRPQDPLNDVLAGLIVRDSDPLDPSCLTICGKLETKPNGDAATINLSRVCIQPGTEIHFDITIDETILPLTSKDLMHAVSVFDEVYQKCFLDAFRDAETLTGDQVFLGGGAGFATKTVVYPLLGKVNGLHFTTNLLKQNFKQHKHEKDETLHKVSPHIMKTALYHGKKLPYGQCRIRIDE